MTSELFLWLRDGVFTPYPVATGGCDVIDHVIVVSRPPEVAVVSYYFLVRILNFRIRVDYVIDDQPELSS